MADGLILTIAGRNLLSQALTGKRLTFTRAEIGDGILASNIDGSEQTKLIRKKLELPIQSIQKSNQIGTCEIVLEMSNKNLAEGFFVNEYGIFARIENEPEALYAYRNTGANLQFLPGDNGVDLVHYTLSLITVISQAPNVTAIINTANSYVTVPVLDGRMQSLFSGQSQLGGFWTYASDGEKVLRPQSLSRIKEAILGTGNVSEIISRIERLEDNLAQTLLTLEMQELYPGYTHYIIEDFRDTSQIDTFKCKVTSTIAGDDSLDCEPIDGMLPGSWYMLSDGINSELVQIHSVSLENGIQRVILAEAVKNTYYLPNTELYRTSGNIEYQQATGSSEQKFLSWEPGTNWQGVDSTTTATAALNTSISNASGYELTGNATISSDNYITLKR